jgi:hypothetical protein
MDYWVSIENLPKNKIKNNKNFMNRYYALQYLDSLPPSKTLNISPLEKKLYNLKEKLLKNLNKYARDKKEKGKYKYAVNLAYNLKKPMTAARLRPMSRLYKIHPNMRLAGEIAEYKGNKKYEFMRRPNFKNVGNNKNIARNNAARTIQKAVRHSIKRRNNAFLNGFEGKTFNAGGRAEHVPRNILNNILKRARG